MITKQKKTAANVLLLFIVSLTFSQTVLAKYSGGDGTPSSPYIINSAADLIAMAGDTGDYTKYFLQTSNINLLGTTRTTALIAPDTNNTTDGFQGDKFQGSYDGQDFEIQNLSIDTLGDGQDYLGLFGVIGNNAVVKNIDMVNCNIQGDTSSDNCGGICGQNEFPTIDCQVSGVVTGRNNIGGLCGKNTSTISGCYSTANASGYDNVGSLCGNSSGTITDCSAIGSASGRNSIGSLCGYSNGTISYSSAAGNANGNIYIGGMIGYINGGSIYESWSSGSANGVDRIGGFVGYANSGTINNCYAIGDVLSSGSYAGGFTGYSQYGSTTRAYATGQISGNATVGGFVGHAYSSSIYNSYSTGASTGASNVGGFRGNSSSGGGAYNCFWDIDTSVLITSNGGTGKTTAEMQDIQTYVDAGWRIDADVLWYYWYMPVNDYPKLSWKIVANKVPDLIGMLQPEALTAITDAQFTVGRILYQYNDLLPIGTVVNQYPTANLNRAISEPVDIVVSTLSSMVYSGGDGLELTPYEISDVNDLLTLANNPIDWASNFILMADLDLSDWAFTTALIGPDTSTASGFQGTMFEGTFNGNQHVIRNLILYPEKSGRGDLGLFGRIADTGQVYDLGIEDFKLDNRWTANYNSGLCGVNYGTISRCYTIGNIKCVSYAGGLCGYSAGTIDDCYSTIIIRGSQYLGGLIGKSDTGAITSNSHAVVDIGGSSSYVGGLFGQIKSSTVSDSFATGLVFGSERVGGLAGDASSSSLSRCFAFLDVQATGNYSGGFLGNSNSSTTSQCAAYGDVEGINYSAGFAGQVSYGSVSDSYATGWVLGNNYTSGFVGSNSNGTINRCYSIGSVVGGATAVNIGGFSGSGTSTNSFWDTDSSFMDFSSSGTGLPTTQMLDMTTYSDAGWSISLDGVGTTWETSADSYPWLSWETDIYLIPGLVGKTQVDAEFEILDLGYSVGTVTQQYSDTIPAGQVISQYPPAGAVTVPNAPISLLVSSGLADVPVPYVVGMQQSQAEVMIVYSKLVVGTVTLQASATIPAGSVISQSPSAGTQVAQQSPVDIVVSNGSGGSVIPNLVALTQAEAEAVITGEGFVLDNVILQYSNIIPEGYVISHNPPAGTAAIPGTTIDIVISDGPMPIVVPDLVGMDQFSAIVQVFTVGLNVGIITDQYNNSVPAGAVISHSPGMGETVEAGSNIDLVISLGATPVSVPTVIGMNQSDAVNSLIASGLFIGLITEEYNDIVAEGLVFSQSPLQGSAVSAGTAVDLWISKGPHNIVVPSLIGLALETATTAIENADLTPGSLVEQYSDDVEAGNVISQSPDSGTVVNSGSAVDLIVSKGPTPCFKPDWSAPFGPNVMIIYTKVEVNGTEVTTPESMLAAFIGGVSAGFVEVENNPTGTIYQLVVTSDSTTGEISFRIFNSLDCTVYVISSTMEFVPGLVVGSLIDPVLLEAATAELRADINHDGVVDILDFKILAEEWMLSAN